MFGSPLALLSGAVVSVGLLASLTVIVRRMSLPRARWIWLGSFVIVFGGAVTAMAAHSFIAKWGFRGDSQQCGLFHLMDGTAERPFVYRRLAPAVVRVATNFALPRLPGRAIGYLRDSSPLIKYRFGYEGEPLVWNDRRAVAFHAAYVLTWMALFGVFVAGSYLNRAVYSCTWLEAFATASLLICLIPLIFTAGGHIYDAPELCLWTATLCCAVEGRIAALLVLFGLLLVNKESAVLTIPPLFVILSHRRGWRPALFVTAALGMMGGAWLWIVRSRFAGNGGEPMEMRLLTNLVFWSRPTSYFRFEQLSSPGLLSPRGANLILLALLVLPMRFGWKATPVDLRRAGLVMATILVPMYLVGGATDEIRAFALLYPFLVIVVIQGIRVMFFERTPSQSPKAA